LEEALERRTLACTDLWNFSSRLFLSFIGKVFKKDQRFSEMILAASRSDFFFEPFIKTPRIYSEYTKCPFRMQSACFQHAA
jgi:hypothetical protein